MEQTIIRLHGVTVFGSGLTRTEPDRALVEPSVTRTELEPANALDATREAVKAVREALSGLSIGISQIETSRVVLHEAWDRQPVRKRAGYAASVSLRALVHDVELIEPLLVAVVAAGASSIVSVVYETSRLPELRRKMRVSAIAAARAKAELYCEAAGCRAGTVTHIEDLDPGSFLVATGRGSVAPPARDPEDDRSFGSGSLSVAAAVRVSYAILPGR